MDNGRYVLRLDDKAAVAGREGEVMFDAIWEDIISLNSRLKQQVSRRASPRIPGTGYRE